MVREVGKEDPIPLADFEAALLATLVPATVEEALAVIPSLRNYRPEDVANVVAQLT